MKIKPSESGSKISVCQTAGQAIFKGYPKMDRRWFSSNIDDPSTGFHHIPSTARLI